MIKTQPRIDNIQRRLSAGMPLLAVFTMVSTLDLYLVISPERNKRSGIQTTGYFCKYWTKVLTVSCEFGIRSVNASCLTWRLHSAFNTTFLSLISFFKLYFDHGSCVRSCSRRVPMHIAKRKHGSRPLDTKYFSASVLAGRTASQLGSSSKLSSPSSLGGNRWTTGGFSDSGEEEVIMLQQRFVRQTMHMTTAMLNCRRSQNGGEKHWKNLPRSLDPEHQCK